MSAKRFRFNEQGTRFRIYLQSPGVPGFDKPATVFVNVRPGAIKAGPEDDRIKVVDARGTREPYEGIPLVGGLTVAYKQPYKDARTERSRSTPPFSGPRHEPAAPSADGHFDAIRPGTRHFSAAAAFASVRCVLEIWEHYLGREVRWFFRQDRLEVIPRIVSDNCWSGEGFVEFGFTRLGEFREPLAENFDSVAHETGHLILKSVIGNYTDDVKTLAYRAHEEAGADLVSMVAGMHFDAVIDHALEETKGRLLSRNVLSRIGESRDRDLKSRALYNAETVRPLSENTFKAWRGYDKHGYSLPFSGAIFDIMNAVYQDALHDAVGSRRATPTRERLHTVQRDFPRLFPEARPLFRGALLEARDYIGRLLAYTWQRTSVDGFRYAQAAASAVAADSALTGGRYADTIIALFRERGIRATP